MTRMRASQLISSSNVVDVLRKDSHDVNHGLQIKPEHERQIRPLMKLEPSQQREVWQKAVETAPNGKVTGAHVQKVVEEMATVSEPGPSRIAPLMTSASYEWYTPKEIIDRTLQIMGTIDLDPCSNSHETPNVPAAHHFTINDNGLSQKWFGRVYMNPPYGREIEQWVAKLVSEFENKYLQQAIALVPARTDTVWFRQFHDYPICFIYGRLKFSHADNSATFPSAVISLGVSLSQFINAFQDIGDIYQRVTS